MALSKPVGLIKKTGSSREIRKSNRLYPTEYTSEDQTALLALLL